MLSASHNPMPDNGIKFFARGGHKLRRRARGRDRGPAGRGLGRGRPAPGSAGSPTTPALVERYVAHLVASLAGRSASTASRSSSTARTARRTSPAPAALRGPGRRGRSRSTPARRPQHQRQLRLDPHGLAAGGRGRARRRPRHRPRRRRRPLPGRRRERPRSSTATRSWPSWRWRCATPAGCKNDTVVATVMSNLGFVQRDASGAGIAVEQTTVGDRYVLEAMRAGGYTLGGEQSGHVVMLRARDHRRRRADRAASDGPDGRPRASRWPSWPRVMTGCRRCWSTCPASTRPGPTPTPT